MNHFLIVCLVLLLSACGGGSSNADQKLDEDIDQQLLDFCRGLTAEELAKNEQCQEILRNNA